MNKKTLKQFTPPFFQRWLYRALLHKQYTPPPGSVRPGDFLRPVPFSSDFGFDRGGPVDRVYIEQFLEREKSSIRGRVLEIGGNEYTLKFGGNQVAQSDVLHVHEGNPEATIIGDLSNAPHIPSNSFDCIILTQTLQMIYHFQEAVATCHRVLKPGGTLLLTAPGITPIDKGEWKETWFWSFTDSALHKLHQEAFLQGNVTTEAWGNVYTATAFLYGMGSTEVPAHLYQQHDPQFQVIVTVKAQKQPAA